jgi:hypothetical protein
MKKSWLFPALCVVLLLVCTKTPMQTGTGSETDTAMIYNPDNTPAVGAVVRFFMTSDSTRAIAFQTKTDANGRYSTNGLVKGMYNMLAYSAKGLVKGAPKMLAANDSLIAYQDSILVLQDTVLVHPDTLEKPGSITGIIGLQPNHNPQTVTVQVLGTDLYSNVDANGRFMLAPVAKGSYNLRLVTTLLDYTPTYKTIQTAGQKKDTLSDTLWLLYTGIPVVTGLAATYDTVNGAVHLSWNKTAYRDFQKFLIFRDPYDSIVLSSIPIGASGDTFYVDSVYKRNSGSGQFSFGDTNDYHFQYRVCIQNNSIKRGDTYKYVDVVTASPKKVRTLFVWESQQLLKNIISDTASINDTVRFTVTATNPNRPLKVLSYKDASMDSVLRVRNAAGSFSLKDTLYRVWQSVGKKQMELSAEDSAGFAWKDTITFWVVNDVPVVSISPCSLTLNVPAVVSGVVSDKYGSIVKCEWKIMNSANFVATSPGNPETTLVVRDTLIPYVKVMLRATNNDGNISLDSINAPLSIGWQKASLPAGMTGIGDAVVFNNQLFCFASDKKAWVTADGTNWSVVGTTAPPGKAVVFNNKIWVLDLAVNAGEKSLLWYSQDGAVWDSLDITGLFTWSTPYSFFTKYGNKLYMGPGGSQFLSSVDGLAWDTLQTPAGVGNYPPPSSELYFAIEVQDSLYISSYVTPMSSPFPFLFPNQSDTASGPQIWVTKNWQTMQLVKAFTAENSMGSGMLSPIGSFLGKLCVFREQNSFFQYSGKVLFLNDGSFHICGEMPTGLADRAVEFNKKLYMWSYGAELWVSK